MSYSDNTHDEQTPSQEQRTRMVTKFEKRLKEMEAAGALTKTARIAKLLPVIETALAKGFTRAQVADALKAEGIDVTPTLLSSYLQRLRARRADPDK